MIYSVLSSIYDVLFIMYDLPSNSQQTDAEYIIPVYNLLVKYSKGNYAQLLEDAYNATLPPSVPDVAQSENFKFCHDEETDLNCVVATFQSANYFQTVNAYQRAVYNGNCNDSMFSVNDNAWNSILSTTPYNFYENYASCHETASSCHPVLR